MSDNENRRGLSRRELLKRGAVGGAAIAGAGSLSGSALAAGSRSGKKEAVTLRVLTLGVEWPQGAQATAEKDLGIKFQLTAVGSVEQTQKAITAPESFDIFGGYVHQDKQIFPTGNLQPIDTAKIAAWKDCDDCAFIPVCAGGCSVAAHTELGDMNQPNCHKGSFESGVISLALEAAAGAATSIN